MKAIVQYASQAKVVVNQELISHIDQGYLILVGVCQQDETQDAITLAAKIAKLRIIPDDNDKLNRNLSQIKGSILLVPQFTLCADTRSNRPSFSQAAKHDKATELIGLLKQELEKTHHLQVKSGQFGAHMQVSLTNDGPLTIIFDTKSLA